MSVLTFTWGDDWDGLYIDGVLAAQGHSIDALFLAEILLYRGVVVNQVFTYNVDQEWLEDVLEFPKQLEDIPQESINHIGESK